MAKVTVYRAEFSAREVEVPDSCPGCAADLCAPGTVRFNQFEDATYRGHLDSDGPDGVVSDDEYIPTRGLDAFYAVEVQCAACEHTLASGDA